MRKRGKVKIVLTIFEKFMVPDPNVTGSPQKG